MTPFKSALCSHQSQKGSHTTPDATFVQQARKARPRREVPAEQRPGLGPWASPHCPAGGGGAREERHCVRRRDGRRVLKTGQAEPWFPSLLHLHAGFCPSVLPSVLPSSVSEVFLLPLRRHRRCPWRFTWRPSKGGVFPFHPFLLSLGKGLPERAENSCAEVADESSRPHRSTRL